MLAVHRGAVCLLLFGCGGGLPPLGGDAGTDATASDGHVADSPIGADASGDSGSCQTVAPNHLCGLAPQCGCGPHQTCDLDYPTHTDGTTACVTTTGTTAIGSSCTSTSGCAPGLSCWGDVCRPYCATPGVPCAAAGTGLCSQWTNANGQPIPNAIFCDIKCALDDLYSCGGGSAGCIWRGGSESDCADLTPYNTTTCTAQAPYCLPGYVCLQTYQCARWCQTSLNNCPGALQCYSFAPAVVVNGTEYGYCQ
jgi:hypothetical protein